MNLLLNVLWEKNVPLLQVFSLCNLSFLCCRDAFKFHAISFLIWGVIFLCHHPHSLISGNA